MNFRRLLPAVAVAFLAVTGCSASEPESDPLVDSIVDPPVLADRTPEPEPEPEVEIPAVPDLETHTRDTFAITWALYTEPERDLYCGSVSRLTPAEAAAGMQAGAGGDASLDWLLMVDLLTAECANR